MESSAARQERRRWMRRLFETGMPRLWCPPITHYRADGSLDQERIEAHWVFMRRHVKAFLVPGSTGDGWELTAGEVERLLDVALELAVRLDARLLIGVLKTDCRAARETIVQTMKRLRNRVGCSAADEVLVGARVCGFTVCPPRGEELPQEQIERDLSTILELGLPTALYQLPQVTQNEMAPETFARLADRFGNLILFKDSSGGDRVALDDRGRSGVFLVRGAEGDYVQWLRETGGPYDGMLLSTANGLAAHLQGMLGNLAADRLERATETSARLSKAVGEVFALVSKVTAGNAFANANKAIDHFMAHGPRADAVEPPMLHGGTRLPVDVIRDTGAVLRTRGLLPEHGYLD